MDQADSVLHLLRIPVRHHSADHLQHRQGWLREERPAHPNWKCFCVLRTANKLVPLLPTHFAFQSTDFTSEFLVHAEASQVTRFKFTETHN